VKLPVLSRTAPSDHSTARLHFITALIVGLSIVVVFFSYGINNSCRGNVEGGKSKPILVLVLEVRRPTRTIEPYS
jgi:hypothetical protein